MDIPYCLTIAYISYENCFQYAGVSLTELINENAFSRATNFQIVPLKSFLTASSVSVPGLILCIANFIDNRKRRCSYTDLAKKYIICIWCKMLIKVQQRLITVPSRNISRSNIAKSSLRKKIFHNFSRFSWYPAFWYIILVPALLWYLHFSYTSPISRFSQYFTFLHWVSDCSIFHIIFFLYCFTDSFLSSYLLFTAFIFFSGFSYLF